MTSENSLLSYDTDSLTSGKLYLTASETLQGNTKVIVTATDPTNKSLPDTFFVTVPPQTYSINGNIIYDNDQFSPINNVTVQLYQNQNPIKSIEVNGSFSFGSLLTNNYKIIPKSSTTNWGGVNSTDALKIRQYLVGKYSITSPLILHAADNNGSGTITSLDALNIRKRIVGYITNFDIGDWCFDTLSVTGLNNNIIENIKGICVGDINSSYDPSLTKTISNINFVNSKAIETTHGADVNIPVYIHNETLIGAITLYLGYPKESIDFLDLISKAEGLMYSEKDGKITIAWDDLNPINLKDDEPLLNLKFKLKDSFKVGLLNFSVDPQSEFADENADVIKNLKIDIPSIKLTLPTEYQLVQNYPNPFNPSTTVKYDLPEDGFVSIEIFNVLGQKVITLVNKKESAGSYRLNLTHKI